MNDYRVGDRIVLLGTDDWLEDKPTRLQAHTRGTVMLIDALGTMHIQWDTGTILGMCLDRGDKIRHLTDAERVEEQAASKQPRLSAVAGSTGRGETRHPGRPVGLPPALGAGQVGIAERLGLRCRAWRG